MSHFTEMKVAFKQASESELVAALESCFGKGSVEVHERGAALFGYRGDDRAASGPGNPNYAPPCHIIVRRQKVGQSSNDVGYRRLEDGGYAAYISEYDQRSNFNVTKQGTVAQDYSTRVAEKSLKAKGYTFKRSVEKDGTVKIVATRYG